MPNATVKWDMESLTAILLAASYKLFWHQEYGVERPVVAFETDANDKVCAATVTVELIAKEKK